MYNAMLCNVYNRTFRADIICPYMTGRNVFRQGTTYVSFRKHKCLHIVLSCELCCKFWFLRRLAKEKLQCVFAFARLAFWSLFATKKYNVIRNICHSRAEQHIGCSLRLFLRFCVQLSATYIYHRTFRADTICPYMHGRNIFLQGATYVSFRVKQHF